MINIQEVISLKRGQTLTGADLASKGFNAIELNSILNKGVVSTQIGINGTGSFAWKLKDPKIPIEGNETLTASEDIEIIAGRDNSLLTGFTPGTAHGIVDDGIPILTKNIDSTKYDIKRFEYYFLGARYIIPEQIGVDASFAASQQFKTIMVNPTQGVYSLDPNKFATPDDIDTSLEIGAFSTTNQINIDKIETSAFYINNVFKNLYMWAKFVKKINYLSDAGKISANATFALRLDIASGKVLDSNMALKTVTEEQQIGLEEIYNVGGILTLHPEITPYNINVTQYDNGTNLTNMNPNRFTSHTVLRSGRTSQIYLQFGRNQYNTAIEAEAEPLALGYFTEGSEVEPIAQIIIERNATVITKIIDVRNL